MTEDHITRRTLRTDREPVDLSAIRDLSDEEIRESVADDPDAAPLADESWFAAARRIEPCAAADVVQADVEDAFLRLLERDMIANPDNVRPIDAGQLERIGELVRDVSVSDDETLPDDIIL